MSAKRASSLNYAVIFDTETTGLCDDPKKPTKMIEAAYLAFRGLLDVSPSLSFYQRYNPFPIEHQDAPMKAGLMGYGALATHHILPSMLVGMPAPESFHLPAGTRYLIGHNIDFDWQVIKGWHSDYPSLPRIDTLPLCRKAWPGLDSYSQSAVLYFLADNFENVLTLDQARLLLTHAHSAQTDVLICAVILRSLIDHFHPALWSDLWNLSEAARVPDCMPFGKHKGTKISDLPADYCEWLLKQADLDPYLRIALNTYYANKPVS